MHAPERRDRRIDPRQFHRDKTVQQPAAPGRAISLIAYPADADLGHFRDDLEGKFIARPIILDHRRHHAFRECTHAFDQRPLPLIQNIGDPVEITIDWRRRVSRLFGQRCLRACHLFLPFLTRALLVSFSAPGVAFTGPGSWTGAA